MTAESKAVYQGEVIAEDRQDVNEHEQYVPVCVCVWGEWYRLRDELCMDIPLALLAVMELFLLISQALSTFPQGCFLVMQSICARPIIQGFPCRSFFKSTDVQP